MRMAEQPYVPERRPIASREYSVSISLATWIAERGVSPNSISVAGMVAGVLAGAAFPFTALPDYGWIFFPVAALLMQLRLLANMLDGMVAVQTARASPVGELFNEVPDRVSDTAIFIGAGYAAGGMPEVGYLAAVAALFTAYVRAEGKVAGAHQEFCGPMAKPERMVVLTAAALYAGLAPTAWQPQLAALPDKSIIAAALAMIAVGGAITALRRLLLIGAALRKEEP
jgi:phosphatidylglycerophosphate synthase